jgi:uncharacterized membrane protein
MDPSSIRSCDALPEAVMKQLFVLSFDTEDAARSAMQSLRRLEHEGQVHFEDTAIVSRDADGKAHVKGEASSATETGAAIGAGLGLLVAGILFPGVGLVVGAAAGAAIGAMTGSGVDRRFVDEVKADLEPGKSALFLVTQAVNAGALATALRPYSGTVLQTTVDDDFEQSLKDALGK